MINFKNFLSNENSAAIGLSALGLAGKVSDKNTVSPAKLQQNLALFSSTQQNNQNLNSIKLNFTSNSNDKVLDTLFDKNISLNFNNNKLIG